MRRSSLTGAGCLALMAVLTACNAVLPGTTPTPRPPVGPVVLASGQGYLSDIAVQGTNIYFVTTGAPGGPTAKVMTMPVGGGSPRTMASSQQIGGITGPQPSLAVDANGVFWDSTAPPHDDGAAYMTGLSGGAVQTLYVNQGNSATGSGLALNATDVFWFDPGGVPHPPDMYGNPTISTQGLVKIAQQGGRVSVVASMPDSNGVSALAADATTVYMAEANSGEVRQIVKVDAGGGTPVVITPTTGVVAAMAVDATSVYWITSGSDGAVMKAPLGGGTAVTLASAQDNPYGLAVDAGHVYWTCNCGGGGAVKKVALGGGPETTLASHQSGVPQGIAVTATSVLWTTTDGVVLGLGK